jgi:hypothetical protein
MFGHRRDLQQRGHARAMAWRQCAVCTYDIATGEGEPACHWYACPYLPDELDVFCPSCSYDFFTHEGRSECGDPPACEHARLVAPERVAAVREWQRRRAAGTVQPLGGSRS